VCLCVLCAVSPHVHGSPAGLPDASSEIVMFRFSCQIHGNYETEKIFLGKAVLPI
jgi:hypothetical protein